MNTFDIKYNRIASAKSGPVEGGGQTARVIDFDTLTGTSWQAWVFSDEDSTASAEVSFGIQGGYSTTGDIVIDIPPAGGGDIVTGTGACRVTVRTKATSTIAQSTNVNIWFVPDQTLRALPPITTSLVINTAPAFTVVGYPPFGRYRCKIYTTDTHTINLVRNNGVIVSSQSLTGTVTVRNDFFQPPSLQLQLLNTVANQQFELVYFS